MTNPPTPTMDLEPVLERLSRLADHFGKRAEILSRYADSMGATDPYRPFADMDADSDHQHAADLRFLITSARSGGGALQPQAASVPTEGHDTAVLWAVERWKAEVENRPLVNKNRRPLDDTWRQVIRHFGGDPGLLLSLPNHDAMVAASQAGIGPLADEPKDIPHPAKSDSSPVPVVIACPACGEQHIDEGEWATTRTHKTHQCQGCGHEWRPFPYATVGVSALPLVQGGDK